MTAMKSAVRSFVLRQAVFNKFETQSVYIAQEVIPRCCWCSEVTGGDMQVNEDMRTKESIQLEKCKFAATAKVFVSLNTTIQIAFHLSK